MFLFLSTFTTMKIHNIIKDIKRVIKEKLNLTKITDDNIDLTYQTGHDWVSKYKSSIWNWLAK